jgi:hypothetical protein
MLFVARGVRPEAFEFVEEAFDEVAVSVEKAAEGRNVFAVGHRLDIGPDAACREGAAERVAVVGAIGEQDLTVAEILEQVGGRLIPKGNNNDP